MDFTNIPQPTKLKISPLWWRMAYRAVMQGKNLLAVGPSGCGKTLLARELHAATKRPFFYVNLGATQDPRSTLIGNTHFNKETGTFVSLSYFAQAIQVPDAIILLDELSRAHPEAGNILMTVLDREQNYLRVDEQINSETIEVAPGVSFIATANIGAEYTSTRLLDRALRDRFITIEVEPLDEDSEYENLFELFPNVQEKDLRSLAGIAARTRAEVKSGTSLIKTIISTRINEEAAGLLNDGFTLEEVAEVCYYPMYSEQGGAASPRGMIKQIVQGYLDAPDGKPAPTPSSTKGKVPWNQ